MYIYVSGFNLYDNVLKTRPNLFVQTMNHDQKDSFIWPHLIQLDY